MSDFDGGMREDFGFGGDEFLLGTCREDWDKPYNDSDVILCPACGAVVDDGVRCDVCGEPVSYQEWDDVDDGWSDVDADADTFASAGMGTDEDYGYFGGEEY